MKCNMKYFGRYALVKENKLISRAIKESLKKIDVIKVENNHTKTTDKEKSQLRDIEARNCFTNR